VRPHTVAGNRRALAAGKPAQSIPWFFGHVWSVSLCRANSHIARIKAGLDAKELSWPSS
jgi:hypothetical protein